MPNIKEDSKKSAEEAFKVIENIFSNLDSEYVHFKK